MTPPPVAAADFRRMVARLRAILPVPRRQVTVRRQPSPRMHQHLVHGHTQEQGRGMVITLEVALSPAETEDTLIHEWAHAFSGDFTHGPQWGLAYARAYRAFHGCE